MSPEEKDQLRRTVTTLFRIGCPTVLVVQTESAEQRRDDSMNPKPALARLPLGTIRKDSDLQSRDGICPETLEEYTESLADPDFEMPPIAVFHDGDTYWLADGWHRTDAYVKAGREEIPAQVFTGTRRDALLYSLSANATHGLPRSRGDKRRTVEIALKDPELSRWSDHHIAKLCVVSHPFVAKMRSLTGNVSGTIVIPPVENPPPGELDARATAQPRTYQTKHGTVSTMNTQNIGKQPSSGAGSSGRVTVIREHTEPDGDEFGTVSRGGAWQQKAREHLGGLVRALSSAGLYERCRGALEEIQQTIRQPDGVESEE